METLTVDITNPKAKVLLQNLADLGLIAIRPGDEPWGVRWQRLSATLPDVPEITEEDIMDEVKAVRASAS